MRNGRRKVCYQRNRKVLQHSKPRASNTLVDALSSLRLDSPIEPHKPKAQTSGFPRLQRAFERNVKPADLRRLMRQLKRRTPKHQTASANISSRIAAVLGQVLDDHRRSGVSRSQAYEPRNPSDTARLIDSMAGNRGKPFRQDPSFRNGPPRADTVNGISFTKLIAFRDQMRREQRHAVPRRMGYAVQEQDPGLLMQGQAPNQNVNRMAVDFPRPFGHQPLDYTLGNMRL
ncbi:hypothetical protein F5144DRAFT_613855 [Chaetomium tenue]|uniref:Uncharacterized protein n=1 Tax=Chaetomium tenue TaxID=1854479 RepID=A0ACB7P281_9PEZI|nr:hypothetical protein F5144DRAFT_613855 [Chaetomium globosum]